MARISASVGNGGENRPDDVRAVQKLLNEHSLPPLRALDVDGHAGEQTINVIRHFQSSKVGLKHPDARVDPRGKTLRMLLDGPGHGDTRAHNGNVVREEPKEPKEARSDRKRRNEFVGGSVREKENTTKLIDALDPHFRGVRARVISGYLNDTDLFWKVNFHP